jgi:large subunit ribosomal protein L15
MPLFRRVAKRGFSNNFFAADVAVINVGELNDAFDAGSEITPEMLVEKGLVRSSFEELKVLGDGELIKNLKISAHRFSASAEAKISAAGGTYSLIAVGSF